MTLNPKTKNGQHLLNDTWSLWYDDPSSQSSSYGEKIKEIYSFKTVENFWRLFQNIIKASDLQPSSTYYLFRKGIEPKWEDDENQHGGRWMHYCNLSSPSYRSSHLMLCGDKEEEMRNEKKKIEEKWMNTLLACIGEDFPWSDCVKGCVFNARKDQMRISLWINCKDDKRVNKMIGQKFKMLLGLENEKIVFHFHKNEEGNEKMSMMSL